VTRQRRDVRVGRLENVARHADLRGVPCALTLAAFMRAGTDKVGAHARILREEHQELVDAPPPLLAPLAVAVRVEPAQQAV